MSTPFVGTLHFDYIKEPYTYVNALNNEITQYKQVAPVVASTVTPVVNDITAPAAAAPSVSQPAPVATVENLEAVLQAAGLTMAVTDPDKLRSIQQSTPTVVEQRVPRERKPTPVIADEPLVQVETQR